MDFVYVTFQESIVNEESQLHVNYLLAGSLTAFWSRFWNYSSKSSDLIFSGLMK